MKGTNLKVKLKAGNRHSAVAEYWLLLSQNQLLKFLGKHLSEGLPTRLVQLSKSF